MGYAAGWGFCNHGLRQVFAEEDLLPISALQHFAFCERRAALILLEGAWEENFFTADGKIFHERSEGYQTEMRGDLRIVRGLPMRSLRLGLMGKADVVEFQRAPREKTTLKNASDRVVDECGSWLPFPIEYKRGRLRHEEGYEVQLCAQALCLEEMLEVTIPRGAVYYGQTKRRLDIVFDQSLRQRTERIALQLHQMIFDKRVPVARYEKKCTGCSLFTLCLPKTTGSPKSARTYLLGIVNNGGN